MTRVRLGHGGLVNSIGAPARIGAVVMLCAMLGLAGCSSKQPATGAGAAGGGTSGLGEEGLGKGSLEQLQTGTLGSGTGGPLTDIHFDYDEFTVRPQDGEILRANAKWLGAHSTNRVQVEGHCDERGSEEYNIALGAKRAQAAKEYLITLGVTSDRVSTISYGKELPLCTEHDEGCWAQNRRAHFVVSK